MTLKKAIKYAKKNKCKIKSRSLKMYKQDAKSLIHWVISDKKTETESALELVKFLTTKDWELDLD